jgi:hypothetical protein
MERRHLNELSIQELKGYKGIQAPVNTNKDGLVQLILGHQARVLTERAQKAVQQIGHAHQPEDVLSVNPQTLEPPTTAYSSSSSSPSSRLNQSSPGPVGQSSSMDIRSRVRAHIHLRKSTEVLDTSGIGSIEELSDESQIDLLSVRQLKTILQRNCIDYRGCVEKSELMERVHRLYQDKLEQKELEAKIIADGDRGMLCGLVPTVPFVHFLPLLLPSLLTLSPWQKQRMTTCVRCAWTRQLTACSWTAATCSRVSSVADSYQNVRCVGSTS